MGKFWLGLAAGVAAAYTLGMILERIPHDGLQRAFEERRARLEYSGSDPYSRYRRGEITRAEWAETLDDGGRYDPEAPKRDGSRPPASRSGGSDVQRAWRG